MASPSSDSTTTSLSALFDRLEQQASDALNAASDAAPSVWGASQRLLDTLDEVSREVYSRVTHSGALVPSLHAPPIVTVSEPPPPSAPTIRLPQLPSARTGLIALGTVVSTGFLLDALLPPYFFRRLFAHASVRAFVPGLLLPSLPLPPPRPRKTADGTGRLEAVLVLGADAGTPGHAIAKALARRGFVVIASVDCGDGDCAVAVRSLEREGHGWIKAVPLDPADPGSFSPFVRSVTAALSLRFPLGTPGDAFVSDGVALGLTGFVNALPLVDPLALESMKPVEAETAEEVEVAVRRTAGVAVAVLRGVLPLIRNAAGRPQAPNGVVLTLLPSATSSLSLPYHSLESLSHQALESMMTSLRRELYSLTPSSISGPVRVMTERVGTFNLPRQPGPRGADATGQASPATQPAGPYPVALPQHLRPLYAPALLRRVSPLTTATSTTTSQTQGAGAGPPQLAARVLHILLDPRARPPFSRSGSWGSGTVAWRAVGLLPDRVVDGGLWLLEALSGCWTACAAPTAALPPRKRPGRPLPTAASPLPSQPPLGPRQTAPAAAAASDAETPGAADISSEPETEPLMGSFVGSEEDWRAAEGNAAAEHAEGELGGASA